jgi:hypothetical protein
MADTFSVDNQLRYSEDFSKWGHPGSAVTLDAAEGPFGGLAAKIVNTATAYPAGINSSPLVVAAGAYALSVYAKAVGRRWIMLEWSAGGARYAFFDLQNGVTGNTAGGAVPTIEAVGNGWYRCSITHASNPTYVGIDIVAANGSATAPTPDGTSGIYVWGAQLNTGSVADAYILTTGVVVLPHAFACARVAATGVQTFTGTGTARPKARIATGTGVEIFSGTGAASPKSKIALGSAVEVFSGAGDVHTRPGTAGGSGVEIFTGGGAVRCAATTTGVAAELFTGTANARASAAAGGLGVEIFSGAGSGTAAFACKAGGDAVQVFAGGGGVGVAAPVASGSGFELFSGTAVIGARVGVLGECVLTIAGVGLMDFPRVLAFGHAYVGIPGMVPPQRVVIVPRAARTITVGRLV